jgi:hypothetical protein
VLVGIIEFRQIEDLIRVAASAEPVEPDLNTIRNQDPAGARRVDRMVPGLLDGAADAPGGYGAEVLGCRAFDLERDNDFLAYLPNPKAAEGDIDCATPDRPISRERVWIAGTERRVAQQPLQHRFEEQSPDRGLLLLFEFWASDHLGVVTRHRHLAIARGEPNQTAGPLDHLVVEKRYALPARKRAPARITGAGVEISACCRKKIHGDSAL